MEKVNAETRLGLIPVQTNIVKEGLEGSKGIQTDFYNASRPTSTETYAGRTVTDADMALSKATGSMNRNMSRMGISPTNGAVQPVSRDLAIQGTAFIAGVANTGRMQGEEMNLKKLSGAIAYGLGGQGMKFMSYTSTMQQGFVSRLQSTMPQAPQGSSLTGGMLEVGVGQEGDGGLIPTPQGDAGGDAFKDLLLQSGPQQT